MPTYELCLQPHTLARLHITNNITFSIYEWQFWRSHILFSSLVAEQSVSEMADTL